MDNKINEIGDTLIITVKPKQKGKSTLSGYSDNLIGLTEKRAVKREFRVVEDELFYSNWTELDNDSIKNIVLKQNQYIQVRYTRIGNDASGEIEFKSIEFEGDFEPEIINSPILNNSMFTNIAWTEETESLAKNLFKKLYFRGIVPTYISRGDNVSAVEDEDYIALFYTIAKFFAIILCFFQRFEDFFEDEELMREWIRQNGIYFDESSISLEQLQYLSKHLYDEIRKRGTKMIFERRDDAIDGEFIRLIRSTKKDELLYENMPLYKLGWCLGQSSPLYRGTLYSDNLNKTKETTQDFENLNNFQNFKLNNSSLSLATVDTYLIRPITPPQGGITETVNETAASSVAKAPSLVGPPTGITQIGFTLEEQKELSKTKWINGVITNPKYLPYMSKKALYCKTTGKSACGLGRYTGNEEIKNYYVADPDLDYEITFMFKAATVGRGAAINFGVEAFDRNLNKFEDAFVATDNLEITEMFLDNVPLSNFQTSKWYFVRGIIHAYSSDSIEDVKLNIGFGKTLTFNNRFIKFIIPKIYLSSDNSSAMYIWNYKIRPLVRGTNILPLRNGSENSHSLGFIQSPKIFYSYCRNNNNSQSEEEITDIIERYLLPFNTTSIFQFISNE
jgi:hypothetical protein